MIVLYYWRREAGREGGGMEIIAGRVAVSEEIKEGSQVRESMEREREEGQRGGTKERGM